MKDHVNNFWVAEMDFQCLSVARNMTVDFMMLLYNSVAASALAGKF